MADEKKKLEARQGLSGFKEIYDEHYRRINGLPPKEEETPESEGFVEKVKELAGKRNPVEVLKKVGEYYGRVWEPTVETTGGKMNKAFEQLNKGQIGAGSLNVVNSLLGVVASPFTLGSAVMKEFPVTREAANALELPFTATAQAVDEGTKLIEKVVEANPKLAPLNAQLKQSPGMTAMSEALNEINQFGAQAVVGSLLGAGMGKVKKELTKVTPGERIRPFEKPEKIAGELPPSTLDQARTRHEAQVESEGAPSPTAFSGDIYGQNKRGVPENMKVGIQELRLQRDNIESKKAAHNSRLASIQDEIKFLRRDDSYSLETKKKKIKELRDEAYDIHHEVSKLDGFLEEIEGTLDYYGENVDKWRPEGRLLTEHAGVGQPLEDMSGTNVPSNVNYKATGEKSKVTVTTKKGQSTRTAPGLNPEKGTPVETGSKIDQLAGGDLVYARDAIRNNKLLHDILQEGINQGKEAHVYQVLMTAARKLGLEDETRWAITHALDELSPKGAKNTQFTKSIPQTGTSTNSSAVAKSDYNARIKEYLRGTFRKQEGEVNNAVQIESTNALDVRKSPKNGKRVGQRNTKPETFAGKEETPKVGKEEEIALKPPTEPQVQRDVSKEGGQEKITPELPDEARIENKEVAEPEITKSETKSVTKSPARDILHQEKEDVKSEHLDAALERMTGRPWTNKSKEVQKAARELLPEVKELMREAGVSKEDLKEVIDKPGEARKLLKENLFKTPREHAILSPVSELPEGLRKKMQENAKNKIAELKESTVESQDATFQRGNVGNGDEVLSSTGAFTIDNFPEWFRKLGEKQDRVIKALDKIVKGEGDEGIYVERLKGIIYDHLTKGETLSERHGHSGKFEDVSRGTIPADREVGTFHAKHGESAMSRSEMKELYEAMPKPQPKAKVKEALKPEQKPMTPEMQKLKRAEKHWQDKYLEALDDPFTADEITLDAKKRLRHVQKRIKILEAAEEARVELQKRQIEGLNKLGGNLGNLDPVMLKLYSQIGRDYMARGLDRFTDWSRAMAKEFGDTIKPHLRVIWSAVEKEVKKDKPEEATKFQQEVRADVADRIISNYLDKDLQEKARREMEKYVGSHKVLTANKAQDNYGLVEKVGLMVKRYGKAGGELVMRAIRGDYAREHQLKYVYDEFITPLKEMRRKMKDDMKFKQMGFEVIDALQDRVHADRYLKSEDARQIYNLAVKFFDHFKEELKKAGYPVIEDYFTHIMNINEFEAILSNLKLPEAVDFRTLAHFISSDSRFTKVRKGMDMPIEMDLLHVMDTYAHSVTKALAFKDLVDYYYTDFLKDIPEIGGKASTQLAMRYMDSVLNPVISNSKLLKFIEKRRNSVYRALLWNNLKSSVQNGLQKELARMFISKEAMKLTDKAYHRDLMGEITDAIAEIKRETPYYTELEKGPLKAKSTLGKVAEKVGEADLFQYMEKTNWKYSELAGVINEAMKTSKFKELKAKGVEDFKAINEALKDQKTFEQAVRAGIDLSARTQISPSAAYRPFFYDAPAARIYAMFTRFRFGQLQLLAQTLFKPLEGAEGLRAQTILRRGISEDVKPVESLRAVEYYRRNLEILEKKMSKSDTKIDVDRQFVRQYIDYLKGQEGELNAIIKKLEPLQGGKGVLAYHWGKYFAKSAAVAFTFSLISETLANAVQSMTMGEERKKKTAGQYALQVTRDINPVPGIFSGLISNPLIPQVDAFLFGNFNERGLTRGAIQWLMNITPGLGATQRLTKFATGLDIPGEATNQIFPKKEKSGGRSGGRGSRGGR